MTGSEQSNERTSGNATEGANELFDEASCAGDGAGHELCRRTKPVETLRTPRVDAGQLGQSVRSKRWWVAAFGSFSLSCLLGVGCALSRLEGDNSAGQTCLDCPTADASGDSQSTDVTGQDSAEASNRNAQCGTSGCVPDLADESEGRCDLIVEPDGGDAGDAQVVVGACRITSSELGLPLATCAVAGPGDDGDPCESTADCAAGFMCVEQGELVSCRPYCCLGQSSCEDNSYCSIRLEHDKNVSATVRRYVPVCAPADNCVLLSHDDCNADAGEACVLVANNITTCQTVGTGKVGNPCPCAEGYVCATQVNSCQKLCRVNVEEDCPLGQLCTAGNAGIPEGFGVCTVAK